MKEQLEKYGYIVLKNFFIKEQIEIIIGLSKQIFNLQFIHFGYKGEFKENIIRLFNEQEEVFKNCGRLIQTGLFPLYDIALDNNLTFTLKELGLQFPNMCTRPVLFFNHPKLAKSEEYYKTPMHQDWPSMQASQNSLVVWVPLVDVNKENGSIIIYPGSHKKGILPYKTTGGFAEVEYEGESIQPEMKVGDIAIFSTKLVHKSGDILDDSIRWSCHFRYTDCLEEDFISRGFPNPYEYRPITKIK
jgi:hypothetical protein